MKKKLKRYYYYFCYFCPAILKFADREIRGNLNP